jgi:hypothetical protein
MNCADRDPAFSSARSADQIDLLPNIAAAGPVSEAIAVLSSVPKSHGFNQKFRGALVSGFERVAL